MGRARAVFVDRDGTLIREVGYLTRVEQIEILPRVPEAIKSLRAQGLKIAVITNQSAVGRGLLTVEGLELIHREMEELLARAGACLDGIYYCPHHPTEGKGSYRVSCACRKPNTGLVEKAAGELDLDVSGSYVVGDQAIDMDLATRIGARGVWIRSDASGHVSQKKRAGYIYVKDFCQAAQWILRDQGPGKAG